MLISVTPRPNLPSPCLARALVGALALALAACGLRSDADDDESGGDVDTFGDETAADPREGSCDTPYVLPFANFEVRGRLLGPGKVRGWCGRDAEDDPDAGPEDSYIVTPTFNVDVLVVIPESDFVPSLRVTKDGCREDVFPQLCATPVTVDDNWHFFAETGHSYTITIDSPEGTDGNYTMQMLYGDPGVGACPIHPSVITQKPGGFFTWSNTFGKRQGEVDGLCGGPGAENMFQVNVSYPAFISFQVTAEDGLEPVLSVRSSCGGATELDCTSSDLTGSNLLSIDRFFDIPGTYYVVVDQVGVDGGKYTLDVFTE